MATEENAIMQGFENMVQKVDWQIRFDRSKNGTPLATQKNFKLILENDKNLKNMFGYNAFTQRIEVQKPLPYRVAKTKAIQDSDESQLRVYMSENYGASSPNALSDALNSVAYQNTFHPVKEYLEYLPQWDGVKRIESLFIDYLGVEDTELNRKQSFLFFMACISRIYQPGCKWDYMPVFAGGQGYGKSTLVKVICPNVEWHSDNIESVEGKDTLMLMVGKWIIEMDEMKATSKKEADTVKSFLSRSVDKYRPSFGKHIVEQPRECVFVGTINGDKFINDTTGGRRFWVMEVTKSYWEQRSILGDIPIDQLWSEAMELYQNFDEPLTLPKHLELQAKEKQRDYMMLGIYEGEILEALDTGTYLYEMQDTDTPDPVEHRKELPNIICAKMLWDLVLKYNQQSMKVADVQKINAIIENHANYTSIPRSNVKGYGKQKRYQRNI